MKTIKMYEYIRPTFTGYETWWSISEPEEVCGKDFTENTDSAEFEIPEGYHIGKDLTDEKHFYDKDGTYPAIIGTKVNWDGSSEPYLYGSRNKRIYLKKI